MLYYLFSQPYLAIDLRRNCVALTNNWRYETSFIFIIIITALTKTTRLCHRGSYKGAHGLLNLLNELGKRDKMRACRAFYLFFATSLINSIIQEHEC